MSKRKLLANEYDKDLESNMVSLGPTGLVYKELVDSVKKHGDDLRRRLIVRHCAGKDKMPSSELCLIAYLHTMSGGVGLSHPLDLADE